MTEGNNKLYAYAFGHNKLYAYAYACGLIAGRLHELEMEGSMRAIRARLLREGCTGNSGCGTCPVAVWLRKKFPTADIRVRTANVVVSGPDGTLHMGIPELVKEVIRAHDIARSRSSLWGKPVTQFELSYA